MERHHFAYKQCFKKKPSIHLSSGKLARFADTGLLICDTGSCQQLISVYELCRSLWHHDDFHQLLKLLPSIRSFLHQNVTKGNILLRHSFQCNILRIKSYKWKASFSNFTYIRLLHITLTEWAGWWGVVKFQAPEFKAKVAGHCCLQRNSNSSKFLAASNGLD